MNKMSINNHSKFPYQEISNLIDYFYDRNPEMYKPNVHIEIGSEKTRLILGRFTHVFQLPSSPIGLYLNLRDKKFTRSSKLKTLLDFTYSIIPSDFVVLVKNSDCKQFLFESIIHELTHVGDDSIPENIAEMHAIFFVRNYLTQKQPQGELKCRISNFLVR